jgi:hypothetical protein
LNGTIHSGLEQRLKPVQSPIETRLQPAGT